MQPGMQMQLPPPANEKERLLRERATLLSMRFDFVETHKPLFEDEYIRDQPCIYMPMENITGPDGMPPITSVSPNEFLEKFDKKIEDNLTRLKLLDESNLVVAK